MQSFPVQANASALDVQYDLYQNGNNSFISNHILSSKIEWWTTMGTIQRQSECVSAMEESSSYNNKNNTCGTKPFFRVGQSNGETI